MSNEEKTILDFLRSRSKEFFSVREISRFVGCQFAPDDDTWAAPFLKHLLQKELIESDCLNHYRLKRRNRKERKVELAPSIARLLEAQSKDFSAVLGLGDTTAETEAPSSQEPRN